MIGGRVIEACDVPDRGDGKRRVYVECKDVTYGDVGGIHVEKCADADAIQPGDTVWWQGRSVYWTPQDRSRVEVEIPRVGLCGMRHPYAVESEDEDE